VAKYGHVLHLEQQRKEKEEKASKMARVKEVLDIQVHAR